MTDPEPDAHASVPFSPRDHAAAGGGPPDDGFGFPEQVPPDGAECPVTPLGCRDGVYAFLSPRGELRALPFNRLTSAGILSLFDGDAGWLSGAFPLVLGNGHRPPGQFSSIAAAGFLMRAASALGDFDITRVRGVGAWRLKDGRLVIHAGDRVALPADAVPDGVEATPARFPDGYAEVAAGVVIEGRIYATGAALDRPSARALSAEDVTALHEFIGGWEWGAPPDAPRLLLGFIGCAAVAGALRWRPHVWVTGGSGSGKTRLEALVRALLGNAVFEASSPTEYGIREGLAGAALPVVLDEINGDPEDRPQIRKLVNLAKLASSEKQSPIVKGAEGGVKRWPIRANFYFSSVNHIDLRIEDRSRITVLELVRLPDASKRAGFEAAHQRFSAFGPGLRARVLAAWPRFEAWREVYLDALAGQGATARQADQLGTLLAMAHALLRDGPAVASAAQAVAERFDVAEFAGQPEHEDHNACMAWLLSHAIAVTFDEVGQTQTRQATIEEILDDVDLERPQSYFLRPLRSVGLTVKQHPLVEPAEGAAACLVVPNQHKGLSAVFAGSPWQHGLWAQTLRRFPGSFIAKQPVKIAGVASRARWIPLKNIPLERWDRS